MQFTVLAVVSYLMGSVPFAYIFTKQLRGLDIRKIGSKNVGTTNVVLRAGWLPGILTAIGDAGKGMLAVSFARVTIPGSEVAELVALLFAIIGHNWPVWLNFHGGGGLATYIGGMSLISIWVVLLLLAIWAAAFLATCHKYLSAVFTCAIMPVVLAVTKGAWHHIPLGLGLGAALGAKQVTAWIRFARGYIR